MQSRERSDRVALNTFNFSLQRRPRQQRLGSRRPFNATRFATLPALYLSTYDNVFVLDPRCRSI
jgi:hypothetical protein